MSSAVESQPPLPSFAADGSSLEGLPRRRPKANGARTLRTVAFVAVVFSTVSMSACLLSFPLVFHYVQTLQASVQGEVDYCKSRSRDMWSQMVDVELATLETEAGENAGAMSGDHASASADEQEMLVMELLGLGHRRRRRGADDSLCCTCQQGPPGLDGG